MNIVLTCATTGGHILPAIAIANLLTKENHKVIFIGSKTGLENDLVKNAGYELKQISSGKLLRRITLKNISNMYCAYKGIKETENILKDFKADLVIGTGGYICASVMSAAKKCKIPYIIHESNAFPGLSVKLLAKNAKAVLLGFEEAKDRLKGNLIYTGTPTTFSKEEYFKLNKEKLKEKYNIKTNKVITIFGGSQGAKFLNETIINMLSDNIFKDITFILVTGKNNYKEIKEKIKINKIKNIKIIDFVYDMKEVYKISDMCITRAGALTINELVITNMPSINIPYPYASENHQLYNAKVLENIGSSKVLEEKDLTKEILKEEIVKIINDNIVLEKMSKNLDKIYDEKVEEKILKIITSG